MDRNCEDEKMNKILLYANYIVIGFFILLTIFSFIDTVSTYINYGVSYEITTIIGEEISTETVTIWEKLVGTIIFLTISGLLILDVIHLMGKREFTFLT